MKINWKKTLSLTLAAVLAASALPLPVAAQLAGPSAARSTIPLATVGPAVNFTVTPQQIQQRYETATARLDSALTAIAAVPPEAATFRNTVKTFEEATAVWSLDLSPLNFLADVAVDPTVQQAAASLKDRMSAYQVKLLHREDLYKRFEAAAAKGETLDARDAHLLETTVKQFRENGFALPAADREKLQAMQERLAKLSNDFNLNINNDNAELVLDAKDLKGLPADFVSGLKPGDDGKYKIRVGEATFEAFMHYADYPNIRKQYLTKFKNRAADKNLPLLQEGLRLRRDIAHLLGAKDFPTLALKDRMAGTPQRVYDFLNRIKDAVLSRARKDLAEILEVKRRAVPDATKLDASDLPYYSRILKQERYDFDPEAAKEYFPVDRVVEGTMKIYQRTLGVTFHELTGGPKWSPDVRLFEIVDDKTGRRVGHFYLDLYPRDGKFSHAAAFEIVKGRVREDGSYEEPVSAMVANFPEAAPGRPALMPHADVETFFHEFGHLMHQTLTTARYASFSGSSVALDFVEALSQMMENFVWERVVIDELSGHWKDGSKLPEELFDKMVAARGFQSGLRYATQLAYATGDMAIHTEVPDDASAVFNRIIEELVGVAPLPGTHFVASFGHLFGGYEAGYYSYLWSKVFAQDFYTFFKAAGVISLVVGLRYRGNLLAKGSERPEMDSARAFDGREPSDEAFMRELRDGAPSAAKLEAPR